MRSVSFDIKAEVRDPEASAYTFAAQKTMYGGKRILAGDVVFLFASENEGGPGLFARGTVTASKAEPRKEGVARQTPRVTISVRRSASATKPLGRTQLRSFSCWNDGRAETELNFKLYRQATNKVVGLTAMTAAFLEGYFQSDG
jgi:hypothetical protein